MCASYGLWKFCVWTLYKTCFGPWSGLVIYSRFYIFDLGVYVPLTETGTLVVDGILASCYSSIDHYIAHAFVSPIRWFPSMFRFDGEDYGMPGYVSFLKWLAHKVLPSAYQGRYGQKKRRELRLAAADFMSMDL